MNKRDFQALMSYYNQANPERHNLWSHDQVLRARLRAWRIPLGTDSHSEHQQCAVKGGTMVQRVYVLSWS